MRKVNCELLEDRVKNTVNPWKAGKFMTLVERPHSANTYALSKIWFECCTIPLCVQTINTITSTIKSWLYQDCFKKPAELVLYRDTKNGSLGLHNVQYCSLALLFRMFCEISCHPQFRHSLLATTLYHTQVLGEWCGVDVPLPPYYNQ